MQKFPVSAHYIQQWFGCFLFSLMLKGNGFFRFTQSVFATDAPQQCPVKTVLFRAKKYMQGAVKRATVLVGR